MVLGGGTIADLIPRAQRGTAMAVWMMGPSKFTPLHLSDTTDRDDSCRSMCRSDHRRLFDRSKGLEVELLVRRHSGKFDYTLARPNC
jgi:hypothetical protein